MVHCRALATGTEFVTPNLPIERRLPPLSVAPTAHQSREAKRNPLIFVLLGAGALVASGILALVMTSRSPVPPAHSPPSESARRQPIQEIGNVEPTSTPRLLPVETFTQTPDPVKKKSWSEYIATNLTPIDALAEAERDGALANDQQRIIEAVINARNAELRSATEYLLKDNFTKVRHLLDQTALPEGNPAFDELLDLEKALRTKLSKQQVLLSSIPVPKPSPAITELPPLVDVIPNTVLMIDDDITPPFEPADSLTPTDPESTPPKNRTQAKIQPAKPTVWAGELVPKTASFLQIGTTNKIPAPWPTIIENTNPYFIKADFSIKDKRFRLELLINANQVTNGGVGILINPKAQRLNKSLRILRNDVVLESIVFHNDSWRFIGIPLVVTDEQTTIRLTLEDVEEDSTKDRDSPFWVGPVMLIKGEAPTEKSIGLLPATIVLQDVWLNQSSAANLNDFIRYLLDSRGKDSKNILHFKDAKILLGNFTDSAKNKLSRELRARWLWPANVPNAIFKLDLDPAATFLDKASWPSERQSLTVLIPNGEEAQLTPDEWAKRVGTLSNMLMKPTKGLTFKGSIPVWVMGPLDSQTPFNPLVWSSVLKNPKFIVIDLTKAEPWAVNHSNIMIADALSTLSYELGQVQSMRRK